MFPAAKSNVYRDFFAILSVMLCVFASKGVYSERLRCERPDYMSNGNFRTQRNFLKVTCNNGYQLQGLKTILCVRGKWDGEKPVCAKKGCPTNLTNPENGQVQIEGNLKAILYCSDNYSLAGNRHMYCNGTHWDRPIGTCLERTEEVSHACDFETDDICGWSNEPMVDMEWKRVMAVNVFTSFKTGPRHDHTTLTHNGGHYMLMESLVRQYIPVVLTSPIYEKQLSLKTACCFQFYYFMYGAGIGDLFVVVKPLSITLDEIFLSRNEFIKFQKNGNQNNNWNEAHFNIEEQEEDFQIAFVAKSGRNRLSDIAVDDVRLLTGDDCKALDRNVDETIEEYDTTTYQSLYDMQSCVGRCFNSSDVGVVRTSGHLMGLCSCEADCEDADTCCPDFKIVCLNELFESSTVDSATFIDDLGPAEVATASTTTKSTTTTKRIQTTTNTTPTTVPTSRRTTSTSTVRPTTAKTTTVKTTQKTTTTTIRTTPTTTTTTTTTTTSAKPPPTARTTVTTTKATTKRPTTTTLKTTTTATTTTKRPTTTTLKTTTTAKTTTTLKTTSPTESTMFHMETSRNARVKTPNQKLSTGRKSTAYVIDSDPKVEAAHRGSSLLMCTLILIVIIVLVGVVYRRYGDHAVAWYMIHFSKRNYGDEETSSITTSFKRPPTNTQRDEKKSRTKSRKKSTYSNDYKRPLVEDDEEDEDNATVNGNVGNIYTEL